MTLFKALASFRGIAQGETVVLSITTPRMHPTTGILQACTFGQRHT
jgi:hypothetical protein